MSIAYGAQEEYNSSHGKTSKLKFPVVNLISQHLERLSSEEPLKWQLDNSLGLICNSTSSKPKKRLAHWRKGRLLEEATEDAANRIGFSVANNPEKLEPRQIFYNCCYENNGYGADFILNLSEDIPALLEAKVRKGYLEPTDIMRSVLPRFYDLDPKHEELWLLVYWGRISNEAEELLWKHNVVLILIPFDVSLQSEITNAMRDRLSAYIAARMLDLMALFTTSVNNQPCSIVLGSFEDYCYVSYRKFGECARAKFLLQCIKFKPLFLPQFFS